METSIISAYHKQQYTKMYCCFTMLTALAENKFINSELVILAINTSIKPVSTIGNVNIQTSVTEMFSSNCRKNENLLRLSNIEAWRNACI